MLGVVISGKRRVMNGERWVVNEDARIAEAAQIFSRNGKRSK